MTTENSNKQLREAQNAYETAAGALFDAWDSGRAATGEEIAAHEAARAKLQNIYRNIADNPG